MLVHGRVITSILSVVPIYTSGCRDTMWSKVPFLRKQHDSLEQTSNHRPSVLKSNELATWEQGWCSGESACLPPMLPGFDSRTQRHMWVEFVVSSRPCSEGFFSWYSGFFLPPQKLTFLNCNSTWNFS